MIIVSWNFSSESGKSLASSVSKVVLLQLVQNLIAMEFPNVLACTDVGALDLLLMISVMDEFVSKREERGPLVRSNAARMRDLQVKSSTVDLAILFCQSVDVRIFPLLVEIFRVLKPGASLVVRRAPMFDTMTLQPPVQLVTDQMISDHETKLLLAGFKEIQRSQSIAPSNSILSGFNAKKPSWKIGSSSLALKKEVKSSPKVQIDVDSDLVDEDSLLTEDLKKLQLPAGDCEIGSPRKACKKCTCVRAEEEEKLLKFGSTAEQLNNPQSACGSVEISGNFLAADI